MSLPPPGARRENLGFACLLILGLGVFFGEVFVRGESLGLDGADRGQNIIAQELGIHEALREKRFAYQDTAPWQCLGPADHFAAHGLRTGSSGLWSPEVAMGWPVFASGSAAPFSPFKLPFYLWPNSLGMNLYLLLKAFAAGFFTFLFLRRTGRSMAASGFGALAYVFCGYSVGHLPFHHDPVAFFPLLLLFGEDLVRNPGQTEALKLGALGALVLYSGHITVAVMVLGGAATYILCRHLVEKAAIRPLLKAGTLVVTLTILLSAPFTVPMVEFLSHGWSYKTDRAEEVEESRAERQMGFGARRMANSLVPHLTEAFRGEEKMPGGRGLFQQASNSEGRVFSSFLYAYAPYFGALSLVLALFFIVGLWKPGGHPEPNKPGRTLFWFTLPAIFVAYALPGSQLVEAIPVVGDILPRYFLIWASFGFVALAAHGLDDFLADPALKAKRYFRVALTYSLLALAAVVFAHLNASNADLSGQYPVASWAQGLGLLALPFATVWGALALARFAPKAQWGKGLVGLLFALLLFGDLFVQGRQVSGAPVFKKAESQMVSKLMGPGFRPEMRVAALGHSMWPNTAIHSGLNEVQGILPIFVGRYHHFMEVAEPTLGELYPTSVRVREPNPVLDLASVSRYLIPAEWNFGKDSPDLVHEGQYLRVLHRKTALPRAYIAFSATPAKDLQSARKLLEQDPKRAAWSPIVETRSAESAQGLKNLVEQREYVAPKEAKFLSYERDRVEIEVESGKAGILVFTDLFFPGWEAEINGAPVELLPANIAFRALHVPAGKTSVVFTYQPGSLNLGIALALMGLLLLISLQFRGSRRAADPKSAA